MDGEVPGSLKRAVHHNVSFMWLMGGLKPDHKTIAEFRKNNKSALKKILKQCVRLCIDLNLIDGNVLFVDGTKIRANANIKKSWTEERCQKSLQRLDERIETLLSECEKIDTQEQNKESMVTMNTELADTQKLKSKIKDILDQLKDTEKKSINTTDPDCGRMNSVQGSHAGYNGQLVTDQKHGFIVNSDVVDDNNDLEQFDNQINQANEMLEKKCDAACADSGYASTERMESIDSQDIKVIVPSQRQASHKAPEPFAKEQFIYDELKNCYTCPEGNTLVFKRISKSSKKTDAKEYRISDKKLCHQCPHFKKCTKSQQGRTIKRMINEEVRVQFEEQYQEPDSQAIYKLRQQKAELPFGHIKRNLGVNSFLMRGREGARAEMSIFATCFNIARMMTILGIAGVMEKLTT